MDLCLSGFAAGGIVIALFEVVHPSPVVSEVREGEGFTGTVMKRGREGGGDLLPPRSGCRQEDSHNFV